MTRKYTAVCHVDSEPIDDRSELALDSDKTWPSRSKVISAPVDLLDVLGRVIAVSIPLIRRGLRGSSDTACRNGRSSFVWSTPLNN